MRRTLPYRDGNAKRQRQELYSPGMVGGGDEWDQIEAEGQAARAAASVTPAAAAAPRSASPPAASSAYGGSDFSMDDDPFADALPGGALELDLPSHHQRSKAPPAASTPPAPSLSVGPPSLQPSSQPPQGRASESLQPPSVRSSPPQPHVPSPQPPSPGPDSAAPASGPRSIQPRYPSTSADPASLIARFPNPPEKILETPGYALRVLWRQMELRQDLTSLRRRRSPDVPLFERALRTYEPKTFTLGLLLCGVIFAVVTFLVFLPVILRFATD